MEHQNELFQEANELLTTPTPLKTSILYHNIYSLKMSDSYLFSSREDVIELVNFLNAC